MASYEEVYAKLVKDSQIKAYLAETNMTVKAKKEFLMYVIVQTLKRGSVVRAASTDFPQDYVVIDIESTGLDKNTDEVIQLSGIKYHNDKQIEQFDTLVHPKQQVSGFISNLTGISSQMLENTPEFHEVASNYRAFIGNYPIIGHNIISFDIPFLEEKGMTFSDNRLIDTFQLAKVKKLPTEKFSLPILKKYFDVHNRSHNSLNDCKTTAVVYQHLATDDLASELVKKHHKSIFEHQKVTVYGTFEGKSNSDMQQLVIKYGGQVMCKLDQEVDVFIDGESLNNSADAELSAEEKKAYRISKNIII